MDAERAFGLSTLSISPPPPNTILYALILEPSPRVGVKPVGGHREWDTHRESGAALCRAPLGAFLAACGLIQLRDSLVVGRARAEWGLCSWCGAAVLEIDEFC